MHFGSILNPDRFLFGVVQKLNARITEFNERKTDHFMIGKE